MGDKLKEYTKNKDMKSGEDDLEEFVCKKKISKRDKEVSAGIIPVRKVGNDYLFLLLRVYGFYEPPKGRVENGEDAFDTAIRETLEETSIPPEALHFTWGKDSYTTEPYKKGRKTNVFFVAETDFEDIVLPYSEEIGKPEHEAFVWVKYDEAKKLLNDRLGKAVDWAWNKIKGIK